MPHSKSENPKLESEIQILVTIRVDPGKSSDSAELAADIQSCIEKRLNNGELTDRCHMEVVSHSVHGVSLGPIEMDLGEKELASWFTSQLKSGALEEEELPKKMAQYALAHPAEMRKEFSSQIASSSHDDEDSSDQDGFGPYRYIVSNVWTSSFEQEDEVSLRWIMDISRNRLICAQMESTNGFAPLDVLAAKSLAVELVGIGLLDDATRLEYLSNLNQTKMTNRLPTWANKHLSINLNSLSATEGKNRFMSSDEWLLGNKVMQWAVDLSRGKLIDARIKDGMYGLPGEFSQASEVDTLALAEQLQEYGVLNEPSSKVALTNSLPVWASQRLSIDVARHQDQDAITINDVESEVSEVESGLELVPETSYDGESPAG